jgi:hypothetical protein
MWLETHVEGMNAIKNVFGKFEYVGREWLRILLGHIDGKIHRKFLYNFANQFSQHYTYK